MIKKVTENKISLVLYFLGLVLPLHVGIETKNMIFIFLAGMNGGMLYIKILDILYAI